MTIVPLAQAEQESIFGGKAVSLGAAIRAGLPVPPGVAVAASIVDRIATDCAVSTAALLESADVPLSRLAVRSSAVGEDSAGASFAGQHLTKLNVGRPELASAVRAVWESARTDSALAYRSRQGLPAEPKIGAVVQMMVEPLFTRNPMTGANEQMIEAAWGLGEAVVSGAVIPDRYRLDADGRTLEITPGLKDVKVWYAGGEGTVEMEVAPELHSALCLRDAHVDALHDLSARCQRVWGSALDIEWALGPDDAIYLLQCRPITAGPAARS
jgi:pyruvate,water dikinase